MNKSGDSMRRRINASGDAYRDRAMKQDKAIANFFLCFALLPVIGLFILNIILFFIKQGA